MTRLEKLKKLESDLLDMMSKANSRTYAALAKQYRDTIREIGEIEEDGSTQDEIANILDARVSDGKAGAVRKNSTKI